jgi:hypothetical protein
MDEARSGEQQDEVEAHGVKEAAAAGMTAAALAAGGGAAAQAATAPNVAPGPAMHALTHKAPDVHVQRHHGFFAKLFGRASKSTE